MELTEHEELMIAVTVMAKEVESMDAPGIFPDDVAPWHQILGDFTQKEIFQWMEKFLMRRLERRVEQASLDRGLVV